MIRALLTASLVLMVGSAAVIREDPPVASRPARGDVTGQIRPAEKIAEIYAVSSVTLKRYKPTRFDKKTGQFRF